MDHVVVDVEIQKTIEETPGGWDATDKLGVAVACVWQYSDQRMRVYGPEEVQELRSRLLQADRVSGYNIWNFDFPVIWGFARTEWNNQVRMGLNCRTLRAAMVDKTDDMLRRIWQALGLDPDNYQAKTHGSCKLDDIARDTLGASKIGYCGDASVWFQHGLVQKVVNYCADDVALERDLTDLVEKYGYVIHDKKKLKVAPWKVG